MQCADGENVADIVHLHGWQLTDVKNKVQSTFPHYVRKNKIQTAK